MGGIGASVRQSAAALALAGHEPHVFSVGDASEFPANVPPGVTLHLTADLASRVQSDQISAELAAVIHTGGEAIYRLAIGRLLATAMQEQHAVRPFEVVEVADVDASGLPLLLEAGRTLPIVVHLHTCTAIANRLHKNKLDAENHLIEALEAAQIHIADAVCGPTHAVVRSTRQLMPIDRDPVIIPHPFVCTEDPFTEPPIGGPILFIGRLEWRKGAGVIAEMLGEFLAENPAAKLCFIGPDTSSAPGGGSVQAYLKSRLTNHSNLIRASDPCDSVPSPEHRPEARVTRAPLHDRVEFTGEISAPEITIALRDCSFCILPSLSENFSVSICEAMAAGRTTIVAANTGSVEVLGDAAVLVDAGSAQSLLAAMNELFRDRPRLLTLSRSAFHRVRSFCDPVVVSNQRVEFYYQVIRDFDPTQATDRLATLPNGIAAAILPCLSRMTAALMRMEQFSDSPGDRLDRICQQLNAGAPVNVLLYGAGKHTARLLSERHRWERHGHRVVGLIDDHPRFSAGKICMGLPVQSRAEAEAYAAGAAVVPAIILSTDTFEDQFWDQTQKLRESGVKVFRLYRAEQAAL